MAVGEVTKREVAPEPQRKGGFRDWITTTDHKKIGILYLYSSFSFFVIGGIFALLIRLELARPGTQFLQPNVYNQIFTLHGTLMIFLVIFPMINGFGNYFVPLHIGALDMAFPASTRCRSGCCPWVGSPSCRASSQKAARPPPGGRATCLSRDSWARARICGYWDC